MKISYLTDLVTKIITDEYFQLTEPFYVRIDDEIILVPTGFFTDLSSVPRMVIVYLLAGGKGKREAVLHDFLYTQTKYTREFADEVLYEALKLNENVGFITAWLMYKAVRIFGKRYYRFNVSEIGKDKDELSD